MWYYVYLREMGRIGKMKGQWCLGCNQTDRLICNYGHHQRILFLRRNSRVFANKEWPAGCQHGRGRILGRSQTATHTRENGHQQWYHLKYAADTSGNDGDDNLH